jgi:hypothetical protein
VVGKVVFTGTWKGSDSWGSWAVDSCSRGVLTLKPPQFRAPHAPNHPPRRTPSAYTLAAPDAPPPPPTPPPPGRLTGITCHFC